ncbi:MAG: MBOAT family protein [Flavobacteriales bacterium]|nr:MBOAT family protein [Flavobacteriales bacterium]
MLFNSIEFALFLPIVFGVFWFLERTSYQRGNVWLLASSLFFYGWWDWRFLGLVIVNGSLDFFAAQLLARSRTIPWRRFWMGVSLVGNLGMLGFFKYYDFFVLSFIDAFSLLGMSFDARTLGIVLPVGISFYTFQSLSYTIDVKRGDLQPTKDPVEFGAYLMFFPQLVAGPIERGTALLPQFQRSRTFDRRQAVDGARQILWGFFKKVVIADQCAPLVNLLFENHHDRSASDLVLGAVLFAFQIYGDFGGYSDIAIGTARLFGIDLMRNFAYPYFSRDIGEFWRRWHISLSTWFRDYLYIPLGGSRGGTLQRVRNTFIIFLVSGFWHGANYTFIAWGAFHAMLFLPLLLARSNRAHTGTVAPGRFLPSLIDATRMVVTFILVDIAWVFFRAPDITTAISILSSIPSGLLQHPGQLLLLLKDLLIRGPMPFIWLLLVTEWIARERQHALAELDQRLPVVLRWPLYYTIIITVLYHTGSEQTFIYFQF